LEPCVSPRIHPRADCGGAEAVSGAVTVLYAEHASLTACCWLCRQPDAVIPPSRRAPKREDAEIHEKLLSVYRNFLIQSTYQLNGLVAPRRRTGRNDGVRPGVRGGCRGELARSGQSLFGRGVDVIGMDQGGSQAQQVLPRIGWFANGPTRDTLQSAGIFCDGMVRFGTQQLTRLGAGATEMAMVAGLISAAMTTSPDDTARRARIREDVAGFAESHRKLCYTFDDDEDAFRNFALN
jgi:hypothetical protein